jgi:hypothetical protein
VSLGIFSESNSFCTIDIGLVRVDEPGRGLLPGRGLGRLRLGPPCRAGIAFVLLAASAVAALVALAYEMYRKS